MLLDSSYRTGKLGDSLPVENLEEDMMAFYPQTRVEHCRVGRT